MEHYFNTEGCCRPNEHYMVKLDDRLEQIKKMYVDRGKYFIINRGRQYGKTTTLKELTAYLKSDYIVLFMDFQMMSTENFANEQAFTAAFTKYMEELVFADERLQDVFCVLEKQEIISMDKMFRYLSKFCKAAKRPVVLIIDEVDSASNNQVFVDFLSQLRGYYLNRDNSPIFHSVILASVYDIKNLKLKLRPDEAHQYNSPWNIAARFTVDMSFSAGQISVMLSEYEKEHQIGMDVGKIAREIYQYTAGYPYLVSAICKYLDEEVPMQKGFEDLANVWTREGITEAVKMLLNENIPLFDSMVRQLDIYKDMRNLIEQILYRGRRVSFSPAEKSINLGLMFGFLKEENGYVTVANRIFEMYLLNFFIAEESVKSEMFLYGQENKHQFIVDSKLNMDFLLNKFVEYFTDIYSENDEKFVECYGRKLFLLYLKPIINGTGNYYIEAQTRDAKRTDIIVDYLGEQFIVEMKIWHGNEYNERGERQLTEYLDYFHQKKGYLLSFNFNKKKKPGVKTIVLGDKMIVEAVV